MSKVRLDKFQNNFYQPGNRFKLTAWYFVSLVFFENGLFPFYTLKIFFLKLFGATIGKKVVIKPNVKIKYPWLLKIGNYTWVGESVWIDNLAMVKIGNHCCISQGAYLLCGNHNYSLETFDLVVKPITLNDGVWIGAKSIVCPGAVAKNYSILTVGSVLSGAMEEYGIYKGNPAVFVKMRIIS